MTLNQAFEQWASLQQNKALAAGSREAVSRVLMKKYGKLQCDQFSEAFARRVFFESDDVMEYKVKAAAILVHVLNWAAAGGYCHHPSYSTSVASATEAPEVKRRGQAARPVVQIDPDTLQPVRTWPSMIDALHGMGAKNIGRAIRNHSMASGYYWSSPDGVEGFKPGRPVTVTDSPAAEKDSPAAEKDSPAEPLADYTDEQLAQELHRRGWHVELTKSIIF